MTRLPPWAVVVMDQQLRELLDRVHAKLPPRDKGPLEQEEEIAPSIT